MKNLYLTVRLATICICFCFLTVAAGCKKAKDRNSETASIGSTNKASLSTEEVQLLYTTYYTTLFNIEIAREAKFRSTWEETVLLADNIINGSKTMLTNINDLAATHQLKLPVDITEEQRQQWKELVKHKGRSFDIKFAAIVEGTLKNLYVLITTSNTLPGSALEGLLSTASAELKIQGNLALIQQEKIKHRIHDVDIPEKEEIIAINTILKKK